VPAENRPERIRFQDVRNVKKNGTVELNEVLRTPSTTVLSNFYKGLAVEGDYFEGRHNWLLNSMHICSYRLKLRT